MAFGLADWALRKNPAAPVSLFSLLVFGTLLIATGSRTPLVALVVCVVWLAIIRCDRRSLLLSIATCFAGVLLFAFYSEKLFLRGTSFRPEIWRTVWLQILDAPWFGHGYDTSMEIWVAGIDYAFADPHNLLLAILYECGAIGLALWLSLYAVALSFAWRKRGEVMVAIASTLLVFGFVAGMTEGGSFLSRPKEHWFLVWIPMALLFASGLLLHEGKHVDVS
jgi:O-antigen ligase